MADLLAQGGLIGELRQRAKRDESARWQLRKLLVDQGGVAELRQMANSGDDQAARHLVDLLVTQGRYIEFRAEVDAGTDSAVDGLLSLLSEREPEYIVDSARLFGLAADGKIIDPNGN